MSVRNTTFALTTVAGGVRVASTTVAGVVLSGGHVQDTVPVVLQTTNSAGFYWGGSAVTSANGIFVPQNAAPAFDLVASDPLHACSSVNGAVLRVAAGRQQGGTTAPVL